MRSSHDNVSIAEQRRSQSNDNASKFSVYQGCGAGTQISGSGSSSGHLNFLVPAPTSRSFWLRLQNNLVQKIRKKHCIICMTRLPHKLSLWIRNPNFRLWLRIWLHHLKDFGSGSSHPKLLWLRIHISAAY